MTDVTARVVWLTTLLHFSVFSGTCQQTLEARLASVPSRGPGGGSGVDWFRDREPNSPPLHPYRLRSQLTPHPVNCPVGTTYQIAIYRHWSDERTSVPNLLNGTTAFGGCFPHMQIVHKGSWTATMFASTTIPGAREMHSDLPYSVLGNLDPCGNDDAPWDDRSFTSSRCAAQGGRLLSTRWATGKGFPVRDPIGYDWGPYVPPAPVDIPSNWRPYAAPNCGYEMYCPDGRGRSRTKPEGCGPQWRGMPELPIQWNWGPTLPTQCPPGGCGPPLRASRAAPSNVVGNVTQSGAANIKAPPLRGMNGSEGIASVQQSHGANTFGPTKNFYVGIGDNTMRSNFPALPTIRPVWPPRQTTCTHTTVHVWDIEQYRAFPYNLSSAGFLMSQRQRFTRAEGGWEVSWDAGFSMIMAADPTNLYGMPIMDQYVKYGQVPTALWNEAAHTGSDEYIMTVVKPVFNVPIAGTAYFSVTARGTNADRGGSLLDSWRAAIDGNVENGNTGITVGQSTGPADEISNIVVNLTSLSLRQGWHTLEIDTQQRSKVAATLGQMRRFVSRHMFEIITGWPNVNGRCTDWIQYPYFSLDYRTHFLQPWAQPRIDGGVTWTDMTRIRWYWEQAHGERRAIVSQSLFEFDFNWLGQRGQVKTATFYMNYFGLAWAAGRKSISLSLWAVDFEVLPAKWYDGVWYGQYMQGIPGFNWQAAAIEQRITKVSTLVIPLQDQKADFRQGQYIAFSLDITYINRFLSAGSKALTLILRPDDDTMTEIYFSNMVAGAQLPGGLVPFLRMVPADPQCGYITK